MRLPFGIGRRKRQKEQKREEDISIRSKVKDAVIADAEREVSHAVKSAKESRVKLDLALRAGRHVRLALERGGQSFESAIEEAARKLREHDK